MPYPTRFYTAGPDNRILAEKVAVATVRGAVLIAQREQERFAAEPAAASIDAIDAVLARVGDRRPDAVYREIAIAEHHAGRPSFIVKAANIVGNTAVSAVIRGADLAEHIIGLASAIIGNGDRAYPDLLAWHADRALRDLVPTNEAARRLLDEARWTLSGEANVTRTGRSSPAAAQRKAA